MEAIKFDIFGKFAHFKNPENNIAIEVTYDVIPKTVIVGIIGAILGLRGRQQEKELGYLEYWNELKDIKVSIMPHSPRWRKHIDEMTNSTGFTNKNGANQIIRKQVLENPKWTVFVSSENIKAEYWSKLTKLLIKKMSEFPIYLGKREYKARILNIEVIDIERISDYAEIEWCDSIFSNKFLEKQGKKINKNHFLGSEKVFERFDYLPFDFDEIGIYKLEKMAFMNYKLSINGGEYYKYKELILSFF